MKKFLASLFGFSVEKVSTEAPAQVIVQEKITLQIIDKNSPSKDAVILDLLNLQRALLIAPQRGVPEENQKHGFLLIRMKPDYVRSLLEEKDSKIVCAYQEETLVGYVLLSPASGFTKLYAEETVGYLKSSFSPEELESALSKPAACYVEQVGVKPGCSKMGIGKQLIDNAKILAPDGLIGFILSLPVTNTASIQFFTRQGFATIGTLYQRPSEIIPVTSESHVVFWS